jgi:hypothetical protein
MKKLVTILSLLSLGIFLTFGSATATYINGNSWDGTGKDLQSVLNAFAEDGNIDLDASSEDGTVANDALVLDEIWRSGGVGSNSALVIEISGNATTNSFGVYDPYDPSNNLRILSGIDSPYDNETITVFANGEIYLGGYSGVGDTPEATFATNTFGFYIGTGQQIPNETAGTYYTFYSQSALNPGEMDQMVAFGPGDGQTLLYPVLGEAPWLDSEYILAWEDLYGQMSDTSGSGLSDYDYNDMILVVESVTPIPEPATMLLLGLGLAGLAGIRRKIRQ